MRIVPASLCAAAALLALPVAHAAGLPEKAPDTMRVCLVQPRVHLAGADAAKSADSVRNILMSYLQGPTMQVAELSSRLPSQYAIEAAKADCNFVLATTLTHRRGSSGKGAELLGKLNNATPYIPGAASARAATASAVLQTAQDFASTVKARDDMQLEVKLNGLGDPNAVLQKTLKRKAKSDGEDLLTPLVEGAAEAVGEAIAGA